MSSYLQYGMSTDDVLAWVGADDVRVRFAEFLQNHPTDTVWMADLKNKHSRLVAMTFMAYLLDAQTTKFKRFDDDALRAGLVLELNVDAVIFYFDEFLSCALGSRKPAFILCKFVKNIFKFVLNVEIETEVLMSTENVDDTQGLYKVIKDLACWVPFIAKGAINWTVETIIDAFKKHFDLTLERFCPAAAAMCGWISSSWNKIAEWAKKSCDFLGLNCDTLYELSTWGISLLAVCMLLGAVEKYMLFMKLLPSSVGLADLFVKAASMALFGYSVSQISMQAGAKLWSVLSGFISAFNVTMIGSDSEEPQFAPLQMLLSLRDMMQSFTTNNLIQVGRTMNSVTQIRSGFASLKEIAGNTLSILDDFFGDTLGLRSLMLKDLSLMLSCDVNKWLQQIDSAQTLFLGKAHCNQAELVEINRLVCKGETLRFEMSQSVGKISPGVTSMITKGIDAVQKLRNEATMRGAPTTRKMPFSFFVQGESRTGKTLLVHKLQRSMANHMGVPVWDSYARNVADPFWSGYRRQTFVTYDDFGAISRVDGSAEMELIWMVSSAPAALNMASIEEKGMYFDSSVVMASTNFVSAGDKSGIRDAQAFINRRHMFVRVTIKPEIAYDPSDFTRNQKYELLKHVQLDDYVVIATYDNYDELEVAVWNAYEMHRDEQIANLSFENQEVVDEHCAQLMEQLKRASDLSQICNFALTCNYAYHNNTRSSHFLSFKRNGRAVHWFWKDGILGDVIPVDFKDKPADSEQLLEASVATLRVLHQILKFSKATDQVVSCYSGELANPDLYNDDYQLTGCVRDEAFTASLMASIGKMPLWQRLTLFALGQQFGVESKTTWYSRVISEAQLAVKAVYAGEVKMWPIVGRILAGVVISGVVGTGLWHAIGLFRGASEASSLGLAVAGTFVDSQPQSIRPNRFDVAEYRYRNVPFSRRSWAQAQSSLTESQAQIMEKCFANLVLGAHDIQICLLPGRRFLCYWHVLSRVTAPMYGKIRTGTRCYTFKYDPACVKTFEDNELCVYDSPMLEDIPASCWNYFCWDWEATLPASFPATLISCKYNDLTQQYSPEYAVVSAEVVRETLEISDGSYLRVIPQRIRYAAPTVDGDCGSLLIANVGGRNQIVGMHVAGKGGKSGTSCLLPLLAKREIAQCSMEKFFDFHVAAPIQHDGCVLVGCTKPEAYIHVPKKTSLMETPESWHMDLPCDKFPSILSSEDPRLAQYGNEGYCPFMSGMLKYSDPMKTLDDNLLSEVADDMVEQWFDAADGFKFHNVSLDEAINGIEGVEYFDKLVLSTSEGFPHILDRKPGEKGKVRYMEGQLGELTLKSESSVYRAYEELEEKLDQIPMLVGIECPKDEKLPRRKIFEKPKTRCFTILPMEYNLSVRRRFLTFVRFIMQRRDVLSCKVGINCFSEEWSLLAESLVERSANNILCCDYASFDGLMTKQVMHVIANMINRLMGGTSREQLERYNLLMATTSRYAIAKMAVWKVECGMPSGFPLTVIMNSILNELLVRYCYKAIMIEAKSPSMHREGFQSLIRLATYGDDNLIAVSPCIAPIFNGDSLKRKMATFGVTITDGKDKTLPTLAFRSLYECDFLKRGFKKRGLFWDSPEEKESLWPLLHYVKNCPLEMHEAYLVNVKSIMRELYMHGKEEAQDFRRKVLAVASKEPSLNWLTAEKLGTLKEVEAFYEYQRGVKNVSFDLTVDILGNLHLLGPLVSTQKFPEVVEICPGFSVACASVYKLQEKNNSDVWVYCNAFDVAKREDVLNLKWSTGEGRGGLPTGTWVKTNLERPSNVVKLLLQAHHSGKRVVFLSHGTCLPAAIICLCIVRFHRILAVDSVNVCATEMMAHVKSLGFLPRDYSFLFS
uniref:RNA1 polyprotein n=1 Tax=Ullucus comovirus 1 TaxID=2491949 RepID=A0A3G8FWN9_9SECO|nr:orf1 [Ullucus comovirus 1]